MGWPVWSSSIARTTTDASGNADGFVTPSGAVLRFKPESHIRVGAVGDSTVAGGLQNSVGIVVQLGNAYSDTYAPQAIGGERGGPTSWFTHLCLLSGGRLISNHNGGVASDDSAGCLARLDYEIAQSPNMLLLQMGITNDIQGAVAVSVSKAAMIEAVGKCRANNIQPVLVTCYPNNTAAYGVSVRKWNEWLLYYGLANGIPVLNLYTAVVDPASTAGNWLAANTSDGVHATCIGAQTAGSSALGQLVSQGLIPGTVDQTKFPRLGNAHFGGTANEAPGQLIKNPLFISDSNADGLADSWTCAAGTKSIITSPGAGVVGYAQRVSVVATQQPTMQQDITIIEGRRYSFSGLFRTTGCEAGGITYTIGSALTFGSPQRSHQVGHDFVGVDFLDWTPFYIEFVAQTGATLLRPIPLQMAIASVGSATFDFAMMRVADLTALDAL